MMSIAGAAFAVAYECPQAAAVFGAVAYWLLARRLALEALWPTDHNNFGSHTANRAPCEQRSAPSASKIEAKGLPPPPDLRLHSAPRVLPNEPQGKSPKYNNRHPQAAPLRTTAHRLNAQPR
jgi:hypothetical protein